MHTWIKALLAFLVLMSIVLEDKAVLWGALAGVLIAWVMRENDEEYLARFIEQTLEAKRIREEEAS